MIDLNDINIYQSSYILSKNILSEKEYKKVRVWFELDLESKDIIFYLVDGTKTTTFSNLESVVSAYNLIQASTGVLS